MGSSAAVHHPAKRVYTDGGLAGSNPCPHGGTWAYCWVDDQDRRIMEDSGRVKPSEMQARSVTNNQTELYAAVMALQSLPDGWAGELWTDSNITLLRLTRGEKSGWKGVPDWLKELAISEMGRMGIGMKVRLCAGHPTKAELDRGFKDKNGIPVSHHNVHCDRACTEAAKRATAPARAG